MPADETLGLRQRETRSMAQFLIWATGYRRVLPIKTQQGQSRVTSCSRYVTCDASGVQAGGESNKELM